MKKIILICILASFTFLANAQGSDAKTSTTFETVMIANIRQLDTASTAGTFTTLANTFERIGNVEKNKWQPYYYAAYCYTVLAFMSDPSKVDMLADKSDSYLKKAIEIDNKNSEITVLAAMTTSCRIMVDPMTRFQSLNAEINALLEKAKAENADNPRIYLLQARILMRTPEAFGGGNKVASLALGKSLEKFAIFKPKSSIDPNWGAGQAKSLAEKLKAQ